MRLPCLSRGTRSLTPFVGGVCHPLHASADWEADRRPEACMGLNVPLATSVMRLGPGLRGGSHAESPPEDGPVHSSKSLPTPALTEPEHPLRSRSWWAPTSSLRPPDTLIVKTGCLRLGWATCLALGHVAGPLPPLRPAPHLHPERLQLRGALLQLPGQLCHRVLL